MAKRTTSDLAGLYLRTQRLTRHHAKTTQRTAAYTLRGFVAVVPTNPKAIRQRHVVKWMDQPVADSTMTTKYGTVRAFLQWANKTGHIPKDPTLGLAAPKRPPREPRAIDAPDIRDLFDTAPDIRALVAESLMACEGLRISEVVGLNLEDISWRRMLINVVGKGNKERVVHLTPATARALKAYLHRNPATGGPVIRSMHDQRSRISTAHLGRLVSAHMYSTGLKEHPRDGKSPHALRHSYGSDLVEAGATLPEVADLMGHADISTTMRYQRRVNMDRTRAIVEGRSYAGGLRSVASVNES